MKLDIKKILLITVPTAVCFFFIILFLVIHPIVNQKNTKIYREKRLQVPLGLSASLNITDTVFLKWNWEGNKKEIDGFIIEREADSQEGFVEIEKTQDLDFEDKNIKKNGSVYYYYRVRAYNEINKSRFSNVAKVKVGKEEITLKPKPTPLKKPKETAKTIKIQKTATPTPTPEPDPTITQLPETDVGRFWFKPDYIIVKTGYMFSLEVHINTGEQRIADYTSTIHFAAPLIELNTNAGKDGIEIGENSFVSNVDIKEEGKVIVSGIYGPGKGPFKDFHLFSIYFKAKDLGVTTVKIDVNKLIDEKQKIIGSPHGIDSVIGISDRETQIAKEDYIKIERRDLKEQIAWRNTKEQAIKGSKHTENNVREDYRDDQRDNQRDSYREDYRDRQEYTEIDDDYDDYIAPRDNRNPYRRDEYDRYDVTDRNIDTNVDSNRGDDDKSRQTATPSPTPTVTPTVTPTNTPTPKRTRIPTPSPPPNEPPIIEDSGEVWLEFEKNDQVSINSSFTTRVTVDTGNQKIAAYGIFINYNAKFIAVDKKTGTNGVTPGSEGFVVAVNANTAGSLKITGFDALGKGPSRRLDLAVIHWQAVEKGTSDLKVIVDSLHDENIRQIGKPAGRNTRVTVY